MPSGSGTRGSPIRSTSSTSSTPTARSTSNGGPYAGLQRDAARKKVVEDLTALGLLEKEEPYETQVGHSDRSKTPIEPYLSDQWFVKMAPLAEPALEVVRDGTIKFFPERHAQQYLAWLGEKRDWPISRQLWWGHRIPVWTLRLDPDSTADLIVIRHDPIALSKPWTRFAATSRRRRGRGRRGDPKDRDAGAVVYRVCACTLGAATDSGRNRSPASRAMC